MRDAWRSCVNVLVSTCQPLFEITFVTAQFIAPTQTQTCGNSLSNLCPFFVNCSTPAGNIAWFRFLVGRSWQHWFWLNDWMIKWLTLWQMKVKLYSRLIYWIGAWLNGSPDRHMGYTIQSFSSRMTRIDYLAGWKTERQRASRVTGREMASWLCYWATEDWWLNDRRNDTLATWVIVNG
jgi:hypothetical protein